MEQWRPGWKVARRVAGVYGDRLLSAAAPSPLVYKPDCVTRPKPGYGPLALFARASDADRFRESLERTRPRAPGVEGSRYVCRPCAYLPAGSQCDEAPFWTPAADFAGTVPPGTALASAVVIL